MKHLAILSIIILLASCTKDEENFAYSDNIELQEALIHFNIIDSEIIYHDVFEKENLTYFAGLNNGKLHIDCFDEFQVQLLNWEDAEKFNLENVIDRGYGDIVTITANVIEISDAFYDSGKHIVTINTYCIEEGSVCKDLGYLDYVYFISDNNTESESGYGMGYITHWFENVYQIEGFGYYTIDGKQISETTKLPNNNILTLDATKYISIQSNDWNGKENYESICTCRDISGDNIWSTDFSSSLNENVRIDSVKAQHTDDIDLYIFYTEFSGENGILNIELDIIDGKITE